MVADATGGPGGGGGSMMRDAAVLVSALRPGRNRLSPADYADVVRYLYEDLDEPLGGALAAGEWDYGGGIVLVRDRDLADAWEREEYTEREMCRMSGLARMTIRDMLHRAKVPRRKQGREWVYDVGSLSEFLGAV